MTKTRPESRRRLMGTDAPVESRAEIVDNDAFTRELNEMLARAVREPTKPPKG